MSPPLPVFPNSKLHPFVALAEQRPWWSHVYPRRYHTQDGYIPVGVHAAASGLLVYENPQKETHDTLFGTALIASALAADAGSQYFWITLNLVQALLATREPDGPIHETPWPFRAFTLLLPKGGLHTTRDGDMAWITVARAGRRDDGSIDVHGDDALFLHGTSITDNGTPRDWCSYLRSMKTAEDASGEQRHKMDDVDKATAEAVAAKMGWKVEEMCGHDMPYDDIEVLRMMLRLSMNAAYYLANVPQAVEESQRQTVKKASDTKPELWSPRWIGKHYARKQIIGGLPAGTHASPRMHWRRGHWRNQPVGEGRKDRRRMWIEPILVMAESAA